MLTTSRWSLSKPVCRYHINHLSRLSCLSASPLQLYEALFASFMRITFIALLLQIFIYNRCSFEIRWCTSRADFICAWSYLIFLFNLAFIHWCFMFLCFIRLFIFCVFFLQIFVISYACYIFSIWFTFTILCLNPLSYFRYWLTGLFTCCAQHVCRSFPTQRLDNLLPFCFLYGFCVSLVLVSFCHISRSVIFFNEFVGFHISAHLSAVVSSLTAPSWGRSGLFCTVFCIVFEPAFLVVL